MSYWWAENTIGSDANAQKSELVNETFDTVERRVEDDVVKHRWLEEFLFFILLVADYQDYEKI